MKTLGVYNGAHDMAVAVVEGGRVIAAVEEERLSRRKHHGHAAGEHVPWRSLQWLTSKFTNVGLAQPTAHSGSSEECSGDIAAVAQSLKVEPATLRGRAYEHHLCHAATAWLWSGWDECYAVAIDGGGSVYYGLVARCTRACGIEVIVVDPMAHVDDFVRPGALYSSATKHLGFKPVHDEGKVMGLAARGVVQPELFDKYEIVPFGARGRFPISWPSWRESEPARADVAATVQAFFVQIMMETVRAHVPRGARVALAGGSFANVMVNRALMSWAGEVFVAPAMNDGGLAAGAALLNAGAEPYKLPHVYLGPDAGPPPASVSPRDVASWVAEGALVALCLGRCEYGPRALGARTILADPRDPRIPDRLNAALHRDGFMPFAPVVLAEHADAVLEPAWQQAAHAAEFMTVAFRAQPQWATRAPAVVHLDGTMRPQVIRAETNPWYYAVVQEFYRLTGVPLMVNTSFNEHGEPIVCSVEDARRTFVRSGLDMLVTTDGAECKP